MAINIESTYRNVDGTYKEVSSLELIFASISVTFLLYNIFFLFSEQIWGCYLKVDPMTLTPSIRQWVYEHDGIEAYVLYLFAFIGMGLTAVLSLGNNKLSQSSSLNISLLRTSVYLLIALFFYKFVGFNPPMPAIAGGWHLVVSYTVVIVFLSMLKVIMGLRKIISYIIIMAILLPICFVATRQISLLDYSFIFSPAYRLIHHAKLQDIYIQYDLLLTALAAIWMKLGLALNDFQIIPRVSVYLFIMGTFIYASRMFTKPLAYLLLVSIVILKIYSIPNNDLVASIQITPLRLDLWLIPLLISIERGIYSKLLGLCLGSMAVLHHNFGLFYILSYIEVLMALFALDCIDIVIGEKRSFQAILKKHIRLILPNLILITVGILLYYSLFKNSTSESVGLYKSLGIGFLRVSPVSFYWYVLALICATFALLIQTRKNLSHNYFRSGLFLLFLVVANSLYFFGRSHEWNILNISGVLVLTFFLFVDLLRRKANLYNSRNSNAETHPTQHTLLSKTLINATPIIFIFLITYYYSERITTNIITQTSNILHGRFEYPMSPQKILLKDPGQEQLEKKVFNIDGLKSVTNNSSKVYILSYLYDFYYYYYGEYEPRGHFLPYYSWPIKSELIGYLQELLDNGFYLVIPLGKVLSSNEVLGDWEIKAHNEVLNSLTYRHEIERDGFRVLWK